MVKNTTEIKKFRKKHVMVLAEQGEKNNYVEKFESTTKSPYELNEF